MAVVHWSHKARTRPVVDTYAKVAFAKLYTTKTPLAAAGLLNDRVLSFYQEHDVTLLRPHQGKMCLAPQIAQASHAAPKLGRNIRPATRNGSLGPDGRLKFLSARCPPRSLSNRGSNFRRRPRLGPQTGVSICGCLVRQYRASISSRHPAQVRRFCGWKSSHICCSICRGMLRER